MKLKRDTKFGEESTCLKIDIKNLTNFDLGTRKCQNWNFDKILSSKVENIWALNLQWSYVSWQWRMIQKLKRNWLVALKLTWTSQNLTWALEKSKFFFQLVPCDQSIYCLSCKSTEEVSFMKLRSYPNFKERLASGLKKDMRNLANFHQSTWKCQNWNFDGILLSKVEKVWP